MFIDTSTRSDETEIMDDLEMEGDLLSRTLAKLDWINKWLGGNNVTLRGLDQLLQGHPKDKPIRIVDIGSGSGDMLRLVTDKLRKAGRKVEILGMDANDYTVRYARRESAAYPEIAYQTAYVSASTFAELDYDILLGTLFLHHLSDEDIIAVLQVGVERARLGVIINDLQRSRVAYVLFYLLTLFIPNPMIRQDGLTSILRGFKRADIQKYMAALEPRKWSLKWRWAFRYQWIIYSN